MYKIGEFSRLCQIPVKTLRYYDEIGLLRPASTDAASGYRHYSADQVEALNRILVFKDLGFSLREIRALVSEAVPVDQMRSMLVCKHEALERGVAAERARLARAAARLEAIAGSGQPAAHDVALRRFGARHVASLRATVGSHDEGEGLFDELEHGVGARGMRRQRAAIWHSCSDAAIDCEVVVFLSSPVACGGRVRIREMPGERVASLVYRGDSEYLAAYRAIRTWIAVSGVDVVGPKREIFLAAGPDAESVTEIQFPVGQA